MTDLFELTYRVARELGVVEEGDVDSGTTTTVVDDERDEPDDFWNKGTLWIVESTDAAAPQGEFARIADFANASGTVTVDTEHTFSAAPEDGDKYAVGKRRYPLDILIQKINEAVKDLGPIEQSDESLTTAASQSEYDLPDAAARDIRRVFLQGKTGDADDNLWEEIFDWRFQRTAIGTADILEIPQHHRSGVTIRIDYVAEHPELLDQDDELAEQVYPQLIVDKAILACLYWRRQKVGTMDQTLPEQIERLERRLFGGEGRRGSQERYEPEIPPVAPKLLIVGDQGIRYPGDRNPR